MSFLGRSHVPNVNDCVCIYLIAKCETKFTMLFIRFSVGGHTVACCDFHFHDSTIFTSILDKFSFENH